VGGRCEGGGYARLEYAGLDDAAGVTLAAEVVWSAVEPAATALGRVILAVVDPGYSPVKLGCAPAKPATPAGCAPAKPATPAGCARRGFGEELWGLLFGVLPLIGAGLFGRLLTCIFG